MSNKPTIGHAAFYPTAQTPPPLRGAGNILISTALPSPEAEAKFQAARIAELERENAKLREILWKIAAMKATEPLCARQAEEALKT